MEDVVIKVEGIGKRYKVAQREAYQTLRETLVRQAKAPLQWMRKNREATEKKNGYWALRDVNFEVRRGEVMGLVGRNGAGKSTLLKILSRITEPTTGHVDLWGRVGSLLEVGTGFHNELSGRDNIYFSGSMLGMRKAEIDRKFDEIVAFAEIDRFLDTPVKRYSSGMYMRLGFAIAAHLEPEILLVDEVLAVGDTAFQKKCMGKMDEVASHGRTILFVSHNLAAIQSLCQRTVWIDGGQVAGVGPTRDIVENYLASSASKSDTDDLRERQDRTGDGTARITAVTIEATDGSPVLRTNSPMKLTITYEAAKPIDRPRVWAEFQDYASRKVICAFDSQINDELPGELPANGKVECLMESPRLTPGRCFISLGIFRNGHTADELERAISFDVEPAETASSHAMTRQWALTDVPHKWRIGE